MLVAALGLSPGRVERAEARRSRLPRSSTRSVASRASRATGSPSTSMPGPSWRRPDELVGICLDVGWWQGPRFRDAQLLLPDHADEPALLAALPARAWLVTYRRWGFDWPLLVTRYRLFRRAGPGHAGMLDLLPMFGACSGTASAPPGSPRSSGSSSAFAGSQSTASPAGRSPAATSTSSGAGAPTRSLRSSSTTRRTCDPSLASSPTSTPDTGTGTAAVRPPGRPRRARPGVHPRTPARGRPRLPRGRGRGMARADARLAGIAVRGAGARRGRGLPRSDPGRARPHAAPSWADR